ncbi:phosphotransferase family protein [Haladaptatus pallidirubidus]|uniref:Aminoglycoside phosphotransferase domain-containing protein n=1 Tax=Haladaptatus pallidirubidus TaxID=1008152 RepID=A0AAV3UEW7_9EURY|nr:phosphotransferase [Haladaptatus pallidirubidus]
MHKDESDVHERLAQYAEQYEVVRKLHDVPPYVTYEVRVDGKRAVCKRAGSDEGNPAMEARAMQFLEANTSVPVPHVLGVGNDYFVAEWKNEIPEDGSLNEAGARTLGAGLATLHEETSFESSGFLESRDGELALDVRGTWADMLTAIVGGWCNDLAVSRFEEAGESVLSFVREHEDAFTAISEPALVHGDYQPENILFEGESVVAVVDWEFCFVGAGEFDLCRADREFFDWYTVSESDDLRGSIREGYESVRTLPPAFDGRRHVYRSILKLDPMRFFEMRKGQVGDANEVAESMCAFIRDELELAREKL